MTADHLRLDMGGIETKMSSEVDAKTKTVEEDRS